MYRYCRTYKGVKIDIKAKSIEEKWEKVAQKKYDIDHRVITSSKMKYSEWQKQYLKDYKKPAVSPGWYHELEKICNVFEEELGTYKLCDIKPVHLQRVLNMYKGKSKSYRKKAYITLREIFRLAYENNLTADITKALTLPDGKDDKERRSITEEERSIILKVAETHYFGDFVKWMLYCGLRPSELRKIKWWQITDVVDVKESKTKSGIRKIPIPEEFEFVKGNPFDYVCTQRDGKSPMTKMTIDAGWKSFKAEMECVMNKDTKDDKKSLRAKISPSLTLYCMRHTYCTDLEKKGVPLNIASRLMGHSSINVTSKIYTHFDDDTLEIARKLINNKKADSGKHSGQSAVKP